MCRPRHRDPRRHQRPLQVNRRGLALDVRIGRDDHLSNPLSADTLEKLGHVQLIRPDPVDGRDHAMQHEVQPIELCRSLHG
jgi:hypothetical protein